MIGADIIVIAQDQVNPDPVADRGCYKRGDIFGAYPLGTFVEPNSNPRFLFLRVPDIELAEAQSLCVPIEDADGQTIARRRFFCQENIKPDSVDDFYRCVATGEPFLTNRLDLLSWSVTDKVT